MSQVSHSERSHSDLPPSSSSKWMVCWGWLETVRQHRALFGTPPSSAAAEEGTRAHEKMELHLRASPLYRERAGENQPGVFLCEDDDEYDDLLPMIEWVEKQPGELYLETRFDFGESMGYVGLTGTGDVTLVEPDRLTIVDLKYGRGIVEVEDARGVPNRQLMVYLSGAVNAFGPRDSYRLAILQPRAWHKKGPIRTRDVSPAELSVFQFDLENAIEGNYKGAPCTTGPHCREWCAAQSSCRALARQALQRFREDPL